MMQILLAAVLAAAPAAAPPSCASADDRVEAVVESKTKELGGSEYCQYRIYEALSDVDGDGKPDFLVVFTVEASEGNTHTQFLAVLPSASAWRPVLAQVGARGDRNVTKIDVADGKITLHTAVYGKDDPMCCPSQEGTTVLVLRGGRLAEAK
jgi:hypothetical protein